jgi:predicted DNA-binding transcriptional regulator AlpA
MPEVCGVHLEPEFLNIEDASSILRLSEREIYRLIEDGEIDTVPYKRRKLIEPASVKRLAAKIRAGEFAPTALAIAA